MSNNLKFRAELFKIHQNIEINLFDIETDWFFFFHFFLVVEKHEYNGKEYFS